MPRSFTASSAPQLTHLSSKASTLPWLTRCFLIFSPALLLLARCTTAIEPAVLLPADIPTSVPASPEQNVQFQAGLLRENLPAYLDFVGSEVLPVMSKNINEVLHDLRGLTDIRPGFFYHGHIDYSTSVSGGLDGLMDMNNVVLQYHTLENPLIYIPYWKEELGTLDDPDINAWLARIRGYHRAISTPSAAASVQYTPLTEPEAVHIALKWDGYLKQNGLDSPGLEMLIDMVYLIDGGKQPLYQESFRTINRFHSIAFLSKEYSSLDNRTHLENTFSPFQINFEYIGKCQELMPVFEEANAAEFGYILNPNNSYAVQHPELMQDPDMAKLSMRLTLAINGLPDDNIIKISNEPIHQPIAFFAVGNYVFVVYGSLNRPPTFE